MSVIPQQYTNRGRGHRYGGSLVTLESLLQSTSTTTLDAPPPPQETGSHSFPEYQQPLNQNEAELSVGHYLNSFAGLNQASPGDLLNSTITLPDPVDTDDDESRAFMSELDHLLSRESFLLHNYHNSSNRVGGRRDSIDLHLTRAPLSHRRTPNRNYLPVQGTLTESPKLVFELTCLCCKTLVSKKAMKAKLLSDVNFELFSTDEPPSPNHVVVIETDYKTPSCQCSLRDLGCQKCGYGLGYHISQPCSICLYSKNNGHFWMFHSNAVVEKERRDNNKELLYWHIISQKEKNIKLVKGNSFIMEHYLR